MSSITWHGTVGPDSHPSPPAATATRTVTVRPDERDGIIFLNRYTNDDIPAHLAGEDEETARRFGWWPSWRRLCDS